MSWVLPVMGFFSIGLGCCSLLHAHSPAIKFDYPKRPLRTVICRGSAHVKIQATAQQNKINLTSAVRTTILPGGRLLLEAKSPGQVVHLSGRYFKNGLQRLELYDGCSVRGSGLTGGSLDIHSETSGDIDLEGYVPLTKLVQKHKNSIKVVWVDSDDVDIQSQAGHLFLAGRAQLLKVRVTGDSQVELGHLRGQSLWLWMSDNARVFGNSGSQFIAYAHAKGRAMLRGRPQFSQVFAGKEASVVREWFPSNKP